MCIYVEQTVASTEVIDARVAQCVALRPKATARPKRRRDDDDFCDVGLRIQTRAPARQALPIEGADILQHMLEEEPWDVPPGEECGVEDGQTPPESSESEVEEDDLPLPPPEAPPPGADPPPVPPPEVPVTTEDVEALPDTVDGVFEKYKMLLVGDVVSHKETGEVLGRFQFVHSFASGTMSVKAICAKHTETHKKPGANQCYQCFLLLHATLRTNEKIASALEWLVHRSSVSAAEHLEDAAKVRSDWRGKR